MATASSSLIRVENIQISVVWLEHKIQGDSGKQGLQRQAGARTQGAIDVLRVNPTGDTKSLKASAKESDAPDLCWKDHSGTVWMGKSSPHHKIIIHASIKVSLLTLLDF